MPDLNELAEATYDGANTYGELIHIVHVYIVEPHPMEPDPSPYTGEVWAMSYSSKPQPKTYGDRLANALEIAPLIEGEQLLLVDDLTPGERNNPIWCTYGQCPNCAFLIGQDGVIDTIQLWFNENIRDAVDAILG